MDVGTSSSARAQATDAQVAGLPVPLHAAIVGVLDAVDDDGRALPGAKRRRSHPRLVAATGFLVVVAAAVWSTTHAEVTSAAFASARVWAAEAVSALSWQAGVWLVVVSVLHYVCAAVAARAAAGVAMPYGELMTAQLAASAANRVTPAGLGGAALLTRYLTRRGGLTAPEAAAAVSSLAVVGAMANVLVLASLLGVGAALDLPGTRAEIPLLATRLVRLVPISGAGWLWVVGTALVVVPVAVWFALARFTAVTARVRATAASYLRFARTLVRQPVRVTVVLLASASTTLLLASGFAGAATVGPGGLPFSAFGALVIGYVVAVAVGAAVPAPSGLGAVDAALAGVLLTAGMPTVSAVGVVIAFRLITFWIPAVAGFGFLVRLRRRGAL